MYAVLDILRTISTTCNAAEVEIEDYLRFVYQHRADIDAHPERYTPHAFRLELDKTSQAQMANPTQAEASN